MLRSIFPLQWESHLLGWQQPRLCLFPQFWSFCYYSDKLTLYPVTSDSFSIALTCSQFRKIFELVRFHSIFPGGWLGAAWYVIIDKRLTNECINQSHQYYSLSSNSAVRLDVIIWCCSRMHFILYTFQSYGRHWKKMEVRKKEENACSLITLSFMCENSLYGWNEEFTLKQHKSLHCSKELQWFECFWLGLWKQRRL